MKCKNLLLLLTFILFAIEISAQNVTFRFANPVMDCAAPQLCYDVEVQSDVAGVDLDEFNMRMYIDNCILEFIDFRNPDPNYFLETGGTTQLGVPGAGQSFFGFTGEFVYIIDNLKRQGVDATEIAVAPAWTYLFQACFSGVTTCNGDPIVNSLITGDANGGEICPPLVYDHDQSGSGFAGGSDGVEALAVNPNGGPGLSLDEAVIHTNWDYFAPDPTLGECAPLCVLSTPSIVSSQIKSDNCDEITLSWIVDGEANTDKYIVERRYKGESTWTTLGELAGINTPVAHKYEFKDLGNVRTNVDIFYQIKFVGFDGTSSTVHSITSELRCDVNDVVNVYPNPTKGISTLEFNINSDGVEVQGDVIDVTGKVVLSNVINANLDNGFYVESIDLSKLTSGHYLVRIAKGDQVTSLPIEKID